MSPVPDSAYSISDPSEAPPGTQVVQGPRGGWYAVPTRGPAGPEPPTETGTGPTHRDATVAVALARDHIATRSADISDGDEERINDALTYVDALLTACEEDGSISLDGGEWTAMLEQVVDDVADQTNAAYRRQLTDHGIRHLWGNIRWSDKILNELERAGTPVAPIDRLTMTFAHFYHDIAYLDHESDFDLADHPRESVEHIKDDGTYDTIATLIGEDNAERMADAMLHHADNHIDWQNDPLTSTVQLADNLALFYDEKLPLLFEAIPNATLMLEAIQTAAEMGNEAEVERIKANLQQTIESSEYDPNLTDELVAAADRIFDRTPEFDLGVWAGRLFDIHWDDDDGLMDVAIESNDYDRRLQRLFDMGQRSFRNLVTHYLGERADFSQPSLTLNRSVRFRLIESRDMSRVLYRKYITDPSQAPAGVEVKTGPRGGIYYETEAVGGTTDAPEPETSAPRPETPEAGVYSIAGPPERFAEADVATSEWLYVSRRVWENYPDEGAAIQRATAAALTYVKSPEIREAIYDYLWSLERLNDHGGSRRTGSTARDGRRVSLILGEESLSQQWNSTNHEMSHAVHMIYGWDRDFGADIHIDNTGGGLVIDFPAPKEAYHLKQRYDGAGETPAELVTLIEAINDAFDDVYDAADDPLERSKLDMCRDYSSINAAEMFAGLHESMTHADPHRVRATIAKVKAAHPELLDAYQGVFELSPVARAALASYDERQATLGEYQ